MTTVAKTKKTNSSSTRQRRRRAAKAQQPVLSDRLQEAFIAFLEHHPLQRFTPNLRRMTLQFMMTGGAESIHLFDLLLDLDGLFDLLTIAETEMQLTAETQKRQGSQRK